MGKINLTAVVIAGLVIFTVRAQEIDVNGSFEKTYRAASTLQYPQGWHDNSGQVKEKVQIVTLKDAPGGEKVLKMTAICHIEAKIKDRPALTGDSVITITMKVKGKGLIEPQLLFVDAAGKKVGRYDSRKKINSPDKWTVVEIEILMSQVETRFKKQAANFTYVVICCRKGSFLIDDFKLDVDKD